MARIDYPDVSAPELADLVGRISQERGGGILNLYRMLLHSPPVAEGWRALGTGIRIHSALDDRSRELAICLVARLTGSEYEWSHHAPFARRAGVDEAALDALPHWRAHDGFTKRDRAVLGWAEAVTVHLRPDSASLDRLRAVLDDREVVELTATVGFYSCVARFVLALDVDQDEEAGAPLPSEVRVTLAAPTAVPPRVFVGPVPDRSLARVVEEAGCQVAADVNDADGIVWTGGDPAELLAVLHDGIRWVQLPNAGVEPWVAAGVLSPARIVTSARGVYGHQVAEHALALILACRRRLAAAARTDTWSNEVLRGQSLVDATVVVVGSGDIGRSLLAMLAPLRCRTVAVTLRGTPVPGADLTLPADRVDEALQQADVVVLAAPSTPRTVGLLDARRLGLLKQTAYVVNVGRGDLVLTDDLVEALQSGRLAGAALDVTEPEPLPDGHPLWTAPGVLITPHTANPPAMKQSSFARRVAENCARLRAGEPLVGVVDAELGY